MTDTNSLEQMNSPVIYFENSLPDQTLLLFYLLQLILSTEVNHLKNWHFKNLCNLYKSNQKRPVD